MPELTEVDKPAVADAKPEHSSSSTDTDTDEEIPELEDAVTNTKSAAFPAAAATGLPMEMVSKAKQSRGEKKARKIMSKLGLKLVCYFNVLNLAKLNVFASTMIEPSFENLQVSDL